MAMETMRKYLESPKTKIAEILAVFPNEMKCNNNILSERISQIDELLSTFTDEERINALNSEWPKWMFSLSGENYASLCIKPCSLLLICIDLIQTQCFYYQTVEQRVSGVSMQPRPTDEYTQPIISGFVKVCQLFLSRGLDPLHPVWNDGQPDYNLLQNSGLRQFDGSQQPDPWTYNIFSRLANCLQHESIPDIHSLAFDIISALKMDESRYPRLSGKAHPAGITMPIWTRPPTSQERIHSLQLHTVWTCAPSIISMYAGYGHPLHHGFTLSLLKLSWDKMKSSVEHEFLRFVDMDSPIGVARRYNGFMPRFYDHHFVSNSIISGSVLIATLQRLLQSSYCDIVMHQNIGFCRHHTVIVYLFILKKFHDNQKHLFMDKLRMLCTEEGVRLPLMFDLIHLTVDQFCFDDLSFIDTELDRDDLISVWLTQCHKLCGEWQDWIAENVLPQFKDRDIRMFASLLRDHPHLVDSVMVEYENEMLTRFVRKLYPSHAILEGCGRMLSSTGSQSISI